MWCGHLPERGQCLSYSSPLQAGRHRRWAVRSSVAVAFAPLSGSFGSKNCGCTHRGQGLGSRSEVAEMEGLNVVTRERSFAAEERELKEAQNTVLARFAHVVSSAVWRPG